MIVGGIFGIMVALSMDLLLGKSFGGGWSEAVANDLKRFFNYNVPQNSIVVIAWVVFVIGIIGAFGAFACGLSFVLIAHFFKMFTRQH